MHTQNARGIACLIIGIAVFSVQDLILKAISGGYPLHQAMVIRSLSAIPFLLLLAHRDGGLGTLRGPGKGGMVLRGVLNFFAYTSYYLALAALPLATTVALYFTAPLFITALSILFLGERVTGGRWIALVAGFAGTLVMLRPGSALFDWAALLPVTAGLFYGAAMVMTRVIGVRDTAAAMAFYSNIVFLSGALMLSLIFGGGRFDGTAHESLDFLMRGWAWPALGDLLLMMACGLVAAIGLTLLTQAYRMAEATLVAPFEYTALFWGVLWGWIMWGDWPDAIAWLGIAILIGAGLVLLYTDRRPQPEPTA